MNQLTLHEPQADRVTTVARAGRFAFVLVLHLALLFWLADAQPQASPKLDTVRMDVRTIEERPAPAWRETVPQAIQPLPLPKQLAAPKPAPTPMPVLAAATATGTAPMVASPPQDGPVDAIGPTGPAAAGAPGSTTPTATPAPPPVVTQARFDADYLNNPAPVYPLTSRMLKEQGTVLLLVNVTAQGDAERVQLHQSSGRSRLDDAALESVRHWRFVPAKRGAQAVASSVIVPIVFELDR